MRMIVFFAPEELIERLDEFAKRHKITRSAAIRYILNKFFSGEVGEVGG